MSAHWRLALRYAIWVSAGAALVSVVLWSVYGASYAGPFLYGVGVGLVSFVSMAATVSMLTRRSPTWIALGVASFLPRYGFVVVALGTPAYLGLWPVLAMLGGFAAVYLMENMLLVPRVLGMMSRKWRAGA
jgi:hypothetical protein